MGSPWVRLAKRRHWRLEAIITFDLRSGRREWLTIFIWPKHVTFESCMTRIGLGVVFCPVWFWYFLRTEIGVGRASSGCSINVPTCDVHFVHAHHASMRHDIAFCTV